MGHGPFISTECINENGSHCTTNLQPIYCPTGHTLEQGCVHVHFACSYGEDARTLKTQGKHLECQTIVQPNVTALASTPCQFWM